MNALREMAAGRVGAWGGSDWGSGVDSQGGIRGVSELALAIELKSSGGMWLNRGRMGRAEKKVASGMKGVAKQLGLLVRLGGGQCKRCAPGSVGNACVVKRGKKSECCSELRF